MDISKRLSPQREGCFPQLLASRYAVTSEADFLYNCIVGRPDQKTPKHGGIHLRLGMAITGLQICQETQKPTLSLSYMRSKAGIPLVKLQNWSLALKRWPFTQITMVK